MTTYSIKSGQQKSEGILMINGNQSICPFTNAIPMQGQMGGFQIVRMPCTTLCPFALIREDKMIISCSGESLRFTLESNETAEVQKLDLV